MRQLTIQDLDALSLGATILGSGGGGDPDNARMLTQYLMEQYGPINIITVDELKPDDLVVPLSMMGAPLINRERLMSGKEWDILLERVKPTVLMSAEIGGANAFTALLAAAKSGLPVLDADMIGRAFPELQMSSCYLNHRRATPAVMVDCLGNRLVLETTDAKTLENIARAATVAMGSSCLIAFYLMRGSEVAGSVVEGSLSKALSHLEPKMLAHGTLVDIDQEVQAGFLQGSVTIQSDQGKIQLFYQNEYLLAKRGGEVLVATPDIIVLMDANSGTPLTSERLSYGLQVSLMTLPAPEIWKTAEGMQLVGPAAFGINL